MTEKINYLNSFRGIAAMVVVIWHFVADFFPAMLTMSTSMAHVSVVESWIRDTPLAVLYNGIFSVFVFFVLSGYVLTYKFFQTKDKEIIISSAARRYIRLFIPVMMSIFFAYSLMCVGFIFNVDAAAITKSKYLADFYNFEPNFITAIVQSCYGVFFGSSCSYNEVLWTMKFEFIGSMLVFALVLFSIKYKYRRLIYCLLLFVFSSTYYMAFILGMMISDIYNSDDVDRFRISNRVVITILLLSGLFLGSYNPESQSNPIYTAMNNNLFNNATTVYYSFGATLIIIALINSCILQSILNNKYLVFLGEISFSVYVLHRIIICSFSSWLFIQLYDSMSYLMAFMITFITSMVLIIMTSYIFYKTVDLNGIKLSKYIYKCIINMLNKRNNYTESR
jgi:peptidoglycan/LPS O-acetylase OafA/YrhL